MLQKSLHNISVVQVTIFYDIVCSLGKYKGAMLLLCCVLVKISGTLKTDRCSSNTEVKARPGNTGQNHEVSQG